MSNRKYSYIISPVSLWVTFPANQKLVNITWHTITCLHTGIVRYLKSRNRHFLKYTIPHVKLTHVCQVSSKITQNNNNAQLEMLLFVFNQQLPLYFQYFSQKTAALDVIKKMKIRPRSEHAHGKSIYNSNHLYYYNNNGV